MIYCVRLYTVDVARVPVFVAAFRSRGIWSDTARLQPGFVHVDLLRNPSDPTKFLAIEFWTSINTLLAARRSPKVRSFSRWLDRLAIDSEGLGLFLFPASAGESAPEDLTCLSASAIGEYVPDIEPEAR
jgi:heme-degrading monooxygenase HmoA